MTTRCPKCGATLEPDGEVIVEGGSPVPVFSCETCTVRRDVFGTGEFMDLPLTFCLDAKGQPFDPAEPDGRLRF